mmetsp:Transcript_6380/g.16139  ORF Transcript_6380/g.16139 Transcript_6380/m.16139 type:complete len:401 (+) Transcript_6380:456-1658(+)
MKSTNTWWKMMKKKTMHGLHVVTTTMMMLAVLTSSSSMVSAEHHDKTLLETNALGYTQTRPDNVAYSENYEVDKLVRGECVNGPPPDGILAPDAQTTKSDSQCQALGACHIGFTERGEWVAYDFRFDQGDLNKYALPNGKLPVDVTIRAAGPNGKDRNVDLKIYTDSGSIEHEKTVTVDGAGFQNFMDRTWSGIHLDPNKRQLRLFVFFVAGNTNLCSVKVAIASDRDPHPGDDDDDDDDGTVDKYIPFTVNALEYDDAIELDDAVKGICKIGQPPIDEPDAQTTSDAACRRIGECNIAFTEPSEAVLYRFKSDSAYAENGKIYVDITARVASARVKTFEMQVKTNGRSDGSEFFKTTGQGFQTYANRVWRRVPLAMTSNIHDLIITFTQGKFSEEATSL